MKKITSTLVLLIFGLYILACSEENIESSSSVAETTQLSKVDASDIGQNKTINFVSYGHYSTMKTINDDERKL
ncbi:hypothetical protein [Flagellimonas sp.]|uniref:hypothetical protein n=1 Tax=Flagellimonas sp. TaxID=2058762 RepID=UPI003B507260